MFSVFLLFSFQYCQTQNRPPSTRARAEEAPKYQKTMYPKVKVRDYDPDDHKTSSFMFLRDFQSLSIYDCCSPVRKQHYVFPTPTVRIPESFLPNVVTPTVSVSEGEVKNDKKNDQHDKPNIRASPIPRPRAVISSPDNDAMIGNKNRMKEERPRALTNRSMIQNRHAKCKIPSQVIAESPISTRKSKETADTKSDSKGKKRVRSCSFKSESTP